MSDTQQTRPQRGNRVIVAAAFAAFLATFNETFLNVAFTPVMLEFGIDVSVVQWLATGYMLGAAVMVPVSAFAYRSFPTRPLFCATVALLVLGSVVGALAPSFAVLLVGRVIQSLGTGMLIPIGMNITLEAAPREKLGTYMGVMGSMTTLGPSSSIIIAGVLLTFFPWRVMLWVFAALSLLCLLTGAAVLGNIAQLTHPKLDAPSVILVSLGLIGLLYGISTVFSGALVIALAGIAAGIVLLAAFVVRQRALETPLVNLEPLRTPAFSIGVALNMLALIVMFAMNIIIPTFMQSVLEVESLMASLTLFPAILLSCVVSPLAGRVYDKHGIRVILPLGFGLLAVFSVALSLLIGTGEVALLAALYVPVICGCALIIGPVQSFALSRLEPQLNPHGVTVMSTGFQIAGCLGSSVFTGVYAFGMSASLAQGAELSAAGSQGFLAAGILAGVLGLAGLALALRETRFERSAKAAAKRTGAAAAAQEAGLSQRFSVASIMKTDVYSLREDATVESALRLFVEKGISGAPVVGKHGELVGIVTDGDIMRHIADQHTSFKGAYTFALEIENGRTDERLQALMRQPIASIATQRVLTVPVDASLGAVAQLLSQNHFKKMPVVDGGAMVGILNRSNLTKYLLGTYLGV